MRISNIFSKMKKLVAGVALIGAMFAATGCKNGLSSDNKYDDGLAHIKAVVSTDVSRTIFPTINPKDLTAISLSYKDSGNELKTFAIWDDYVKFSKADIILEAGSKYTFVLSANKAGTKLSARKTVELKSGVNNIEFNLDIEDSGTENGTLEIVAAFEKGIEIESSEYKLFSVSDAGETREVYSDYSINVKSYEDGSQHIDFSKDDLKAGTYKVTLRLTDSEGNVAYISDYAWVTSGCVSAESYVLTKTEWADTYAVANAVYGNGYKDDEIVKHIGVKPDPDGSGVIVTLKYQDDDGTWIDAQVEEISNGIILNPAHNYANDKLIDDPLPTKEASESVYLFPYVQDNKQYIFKLSYNMDTDKDGFADVWKEEYVTTTANGGSLALFDFDNTNYSVAKLKLSEDDSVLKLTKDISKLFNQEKYKKENFDWLKSYIRVYSGKKDWSDTETVYDSFDNNEQIWNSSFGSEEYNSLISEEGFEISNGDSLEKLAQRDTWWAAAGTIFIEKGMTSQFCIKEIVSEETKFTYVPRVCYTYEFPGTDIKTVKRLYKTGKEVILPDTSIIPGIKWYLMGWYDNEEMTGDAVTKVSANDNTEAKTFYGKLERGFYRNNWGDISKGEYNYAINDLLEDVTEMDIEGIKEGESIAVTFSGVPSDDYDGPITMIFTNQPLKEDGEGRDWIDFVNVTKNMTLKAGEEFTSTFICTVFKDVEKFEKAQYALYLDSSVWEATEASNSNNLIIEDYQIDIDLTPEFIGHKLFVEGNILPLKTLKGTDVVLPTDSSEDELIKQAINKQHKVVWYDNKDFEGTPVATISAAENTASKTFYGKVTYVFGINKWGDVSNGEYNFSNDSYIKFHSNDVEEIKKDDLILVKFSGVSSMNYDGGLQLFVVDASTGWNNCGSTYENIKMVKGEPFEVSIAFHAEKDIPDFYSSKLTMTLFNEGYDDEDYENRADLTLSDVDLSIEINPESVEVTYVVAGKSQVKKYVKGVKANLDTSVGPLESTKINDILLISGWYTTEDFTGEPIKSISASDNTENVTLYGKVEMKFPLFVWGDEDKGQYSFSNYSPADYFLDVEKSANEDDFILIEVTGTPSMNYKGQLNMDIYDYSTGEYSQAARGSKNIEITKGEKCVIPVLLKYEKNVVSLLDKGICISFYNSGYEEADYKNREVMVLNDVSINVVYDPEVVSITYQGTIFDGGLWATDYVVKGSEVVLREPDKVKYAKFAGWYDNRNNSKWGANGGVGDAEPIVTYTADENLIVHSKYDLSFEADGFIDDTKKKVNVANVSAAIGDWWWDYNEDNHDADSLYETELKENDIVKIRFNGRADKDISNICCQLQNFDNDTWYFLNASYGEEIKAGEDFDLSFEIPITWTSAYTKDMRLNLVTNYGYEEAITYTVTDWNVSMEIITAED